jgi:hypothetical protein
MACECERDSGTNLSQALYLVGGRVVEEKIHAGGARVATLIKAGLSDEGIVEELYLATLSRYPREEEAARLRERLAGAADRRRALEDVLWALLNQSEFLFQH